MKNKSTFFLLLFLSLLATVLAIWKIFLAPKPTSTSPVTLISPSPILLPTPTSFSGRGDPDIEKEIYQKTQENYPLLSFVPFQTLNWKIDYTGPLTLEVTFKKDTPETREEVLSWIKSKGVDPQTHDIKWVTP